MTTNTEWLTIISDLHFQALYSEAQNVLIFKYFDETQFQESKVYVEYDRNRAIGSAVDEWRLVENSWRTELRQRRAELESGVAA